MSWLCKIFGHKWRCVRSYEQQDGGITEVYRCERCGKEHLEQDIG